MYLTFLQETLPELLEVVLLEVRREMFFQHDGISAHCTNAIREYLDESFGSRWIGRGGPTIWPPPFSDLSPLRLLSLGVHAKPGVRDSSGDTGVDSASNRYEYQESFWGVKSGRPPSVSRLSR
jgi:hypothetical protein